MTGGNSVRLPGVARWGRPRASPYRAPGVDRAGVSASHGDHKVGGFDYFVGEGLGNSATTGTTQTGPRVFLVVRGPGHRQCPQPVLREPSGERRQMFGDSRSFCQGSVAVGDIPLDGFLGERRAESVGEPLGDPPQHWRELDLTADPGWSEREPRRWMDGVTRPPLPVGRTSSRCPPWV